MRVRGRRDMVSESKVEGMVEVKNIFEKEAPTMYSQRANTRFDIEAC